MLDWSRGKRSPRARTIKDSKYIHQSPWWWRWSSLGLTPKVSIKKTCPLSMLSHRDLLSPLRIAITFNAKKCSLNKKIIHLAKKRFKAAPPSSTPKRMNSCNYPAPAGRIFYVPHFPVCVYGEECVRWCHCPAMAVSGSGSNCNSCVCVVRWGVHSSGCATV